MMKWTKNAKNGRISEKCLIAQSAHKYGQKDQKMLKCFFLKCRKAQMVWIVQKWPIGLKSDKIGQMVKKGSKCPKSAKNGQLVIKNKNSKSTKDVKQSEKCEKY